MKFNLFIPLMVMSCAACAQQAPVGRDTAKMVCLLRKCYPKLSRQELKEIALQSTNCRQGPPGNADAVNTFNALSLAAEYER